MHILSRLKLIKAFAFDMDGVLTDGTVLVDRDDQWIRNMNIRDGYALQLAVKSGFPVTVISGSDSPYVQSRLHKLGVRDVFMNVSDKEKILRDFALEKKMGLHEILFMGDDIPDYGCMKLAGVAACPADASSEIRTIASYISPRPGGCGCVRDVIEKVLKLNNRWTLQNDIAST
jgi:3-deoxy-D-manno-octulosonate 8-phosphate phosphatase (KDO 8-P phosphatase)